MRLRSKTEHVGLLLVAYVPFLVSSPGRVSADSKQYLYLDPGRFLARASDLWDPTIGAGTVPHQHLGYLFPVGPWFWVFDKVGVPDWVAQRLWLGTLSAAAALGARWLFAQLGTGRTGAAAGALVYALTPYQLAFTARISVLLLPWAALPWLVGLTMRATRTRDWRAPALLGLALVATGGINASSLLLVGIAPALWVALELGTARRVEVARAAARVAVIALGVSLWWLLGLRLQGAYGLPVLDLTENVRTVAEASTPGDLLRGLGNWFFYGRDRSGYSIDQAGDYATNRVVVLLSYAVPLAGLVAGAVVRWAHRTYFGLLIVAGVVVGVGAWPYDDPSPYGSAWRSFTSETSLGLAFRNSPRVVPIIVLGIAAMLAAAVGALPPVPWRRAGGAAVAGLAVGALLPVWQGGYLSEGVDRPEDIPAYWREAAAAIDAGDHRTRVLEIPGVSFATYRWGTTVDPITPGLTDRPYLAREILPYGTPPSVNLLDALDRRMQLGTFEGASLGPLARLLGVGTVSLRADLDRSGRFDTPPPGPLWDALTDPPPYDLGPPTGFGPSSEGPGPHPPSVALFDVLDPRPIVRIAPTEGPIVLAGDGDGLVDAGAAGLLNGDRLVLYGSALDDPALRQALDAGARLVITDSNRRRIQTWFYSLRDTRGPTEEAGRTAPDPTGYDVRLDPFPGTSDDSRTVVEQVGGHASATMEGGPERPEDRAARALDGDPATAWRVGGADPRGQAITLVSEAPVVARSIDLRQPDGPAGARVLARVRVVVNGGAPIDVDLGPESLAGEGQRVAFPEQDVRDLRVEILETTPPAPTPADVARVGLAELALGAVRVDEVVRPPVDLLARVGTSLEGHPLDIVLTRLRLELPGTDRQDDETRLIRRIDLPLARNFSLRGTVRGEDLVRGGFTSLGDAEPCTTDVLAVDGTPVPVRLQASLDESGAGDLAACEPLALDAGNHRIEALGTSPVDVDRLVLSTADDTPAPGDAPPPAPVGTSVRVLDQEATSLHLEVETGGEPFWLVLGQSNSNGWSARTEGGSVGSRQLVDGYANGWLVTPEGRGRFTIDLRWGPQRLIWLGGGVSAVAVLACVTLLVRGRRRGPVAPSPALAASPALAPLSRAGTPLPRGEAFAVAALVGLGSFVVTTPPVAAVAAGLALAGALLPVWEWVPVLVGPVTLVASRVGARSSLAWLAVAMLAADLAVSARRAVTRPPVPR